MHVRTDKPPSSRMKKTNGNGQVHLPGPGHPAMTPDIRPLEHPQQQQPRRPSLQGPDIRRPARTSGQSPEIRPKARTSGATLQNIQKFCPPARTSGPQPRHPASPQAPDIRPVARTSGHPGLRTVRAEARVPLRPPRLYILLLLHLSRVSIGLAHL